MAILLTEIMLYAGLFAKKDKTLPFYLTAFTNL